MSLNSFELVTIGLSQSTSSPISSIMTVRFLPDKDDYIKIVTGFSTSVKRFAQLDRIDSMRYTILSSASGHYRISRNGIERFVVKDGRHEPFVAKFGEIELLCDDSVFEYSKHNITYLPSNSVIRTLIQHKYKVSPEVNVVLVVIEDESGLITDTWFEMEPGLWSNPAVCQALNTFFSSR